MKYLNVFENVLNDIIGEDVGVLLTGKLMEGGNIFKAPGWTKEKPAMLTSRISRENIPATVKHLEKLTGINLANNLLGSTGVSPSSGDMDIAIDANTISKDEFVQRLLSAGVSPEDIKKTGESVHYKSPIVGQKEYYVQVDFMFVPDVSFAIWSLKTSPGTQYKGVYKQKLLADLTRTVNPDWKWNHFRGVLSRADNSSVFGFNPDKIAKGLLGSSASAKDLESVESIFAKLRSQKHEQDVKNAYRATVGDDEAAPKIDEDSKPSVGREFQHLEDHVYIDGVPGVKKAIDILLNVGKRSESLEVKWDGSPAIIFGRNENGVFHFGDKYSKEILTSPTDVYNYYTRTGGSEERANFAKRMASLANLYERATPTNFRGFIEGGLLYASPPPKNSQGEFYFQPNTVIYYVDSKSDLGRRIEDSQSGCAATAYFDKLPAMGGKRTPVGNTWTVFTDPGVVVIPPKLAQGKAKIDVAEAHSIYKYAANPTNSRALTAYITPEPGLSDIKNIIYSYVNSQVTSPSLMFDLGDNFVQWIQDSKKISDQKKEKLLQRIENNQLGHKVLWDTIRAIMLLKDDVIESLEHQTLGSVGIRADLGKKYGPGGEGFVYDVDGGRDPTKFVRRGAFTAANVERDRVQENTSRTGNSDTAVIGWGRGMGHKGHMYLASAVITTAAELGADPYFILSRTVGEDDPLMPEEKLSIYRKVFPKYKNIFQIATDEFPTLPAMLATLKDKGYKNAVVVVGEDQKQAFQFLTKPTKKTGQLPVQFDNIKVISRQETRDPNATNPGPRATPMREILKKPNATYDEKFAFWREAMPSQLSDKDVARYMKLAAERMGFPIDGQVDNNIKEADNPNYFGGTSLSPISGTPNSLQPQPDREDVEQYQKEMLELKRFLGR